MRNALLLLNVSVSLSALLSPPAPGSIWVVHPVQNETLRSDLLQTVLRPISGLKSTEIITVSLDGVEIQNFKVSIGDTDLRFVNSTISDGAHELIVCLGTSRCKSIQFQVDTTTLPHRLWSPTQLMPKGSTDRIAFHSASLCAAMQTLVPRFEPLIDASCRPFRLAHRGDRKLEPGEPSSAGWDYHRLEEGTNEWSLTVGNVLCLCPKLFLKSEIMAKIDLAVAHTSKRLIWAFQDSDEMTDEETTQVFAAGGLIRNQPASMDLQASLASTDTSFSNIRLAIFDRGLPSPDVFFASPGLPADAVWPDAGLITVEPCVSGWVHSDLFGSVWHNNLPLFNFSTTEVVEMGEGEACHSKEVLLNAGLHIFIVEMRSSFGGVVLGRSESRVRLKSPADASLTELPPKVRGMRAYVRKGAEGETGVTLPEPRPEQYRDFIESDSGLVLVDWLRMDDTRGPELSSDVRVLVDDSDAKIFLADRWVVNRYLGSALRRNFYYYNKMDGYLFEAIEAFGGLAGKHVFVVGSNCPWYEMIAVARAARVTSVDYHHMFYDHPNVTNVVAKGPLSPVERADVVFSISSFEHDGLGRYGDPISPDADLAAAESMKRALKENGLMFVSVPIGHDEVVFNACRVYGRGRLERLFRGWKILAHFGFDENAMDRVGWFHEQPVFVLQPA